MPQQTATQSSPPFKNVTENTRIFVPVTKAWYHQFECLGKTWEVRRRGRQWTQEHIRVGRRVEIRCGYRIGRSLWGTIESVLEANTIEDLFRKVPFTEIWPMVQGYQERAFQLAELEFFGGGLNWMPRLRIEPVGLIAFEIAFDKN